MEWATVASEAIHFSGPPKLKADPRAGPGGRAMHRQSCKALVLCLPKKPQEPRHLVSPPNLHSGIAWQVCSPPSPRGSGPQKIIPEEQKAPLKPCTLLRLWWEGEAQPSCRACLSTLLGPFPSQHNRGVCLDSQSFT